MSDRQAALVIGGLAGFLWAYGMIAVPWMRWPLLVGAMLLARRLR